MWEFRQKQQYSVVWKPDETKVSLKKTPTGINSIHPIVNNSKFITRHSAHIFFIIIFIKSQLKLYQVYVNKNKLQVMSTYINHEK